MWTEGRERGSDGTGGIEGMSEGTERNGWGEDCSDYRVRDSDRMR